MILAPAGGVAIGMGLHCIMLAALNVAVARYASTDIWLFYKTIADIGVAGALSLLVFA